MKLVKINTEVFKCVIDVERLTAIHIHTGWNDKGVARQFLILNIDEDSITPFSGEDKTEVKAAYALYWR